MNDKNIKLLYSAIGSFMLVLLQLDLFQGAIGIFNTMGIYFVAQILYSISVILSFVGAIIFVICAIRLLLNNFKLKM